MLFWGVYYSKNILEIVLWGVYGHISHIWSQRDAEEELITLLAPAALTLTFDHNHLKQKFNNSQKTI